MSNSTGGSPTDQWIGNSYNIKPGVADQISAGYSRNFDDNAYELNAEASGHRAGQIKQPSESR